MPEIDANDFPFVFPNLAHQAEEWEVGRDAEYRALFWDPGLGKSKAAIDKMGWLWLNGKIDTVVIIAKRGEYSNWPTVELPEHMPAAVPYVQARYRSGLRAEEKASIKRLVNEHRDKLRILVINIESLPFEGGKVARAFVKSRRKGLMLVLDESTCAKTVKAARSKVVYELTKFAKYKTIMTGTPITRSPMDLWGQCKVLGDGVLGHSSFFAFKSDYAIEEVVYLGTRHFNQITGYKNLDRLNLKLKTFASIKTRDECLDLPPKIYKKIEVPMTGRQQELYEMMRDEAIAVFKDGEILESVNALGIMSRLDQIACGQLRKEDGSFEIIESNRPEALLEKLEISSVKGIIWCNYRGLLEYLYGLISKEYGPETVGRYYGGVVDGEREETISAFKDPDNKLRWIVANQQSMGYGRTLVIGKENYYFSNGPNLEHRLQSEDRTMRIGQTSSVLYTDFFSSDTINERMLTLLRQKKSLSHLVLGTKITDWI